jgi:hypothetical protein
LDEFAWNGKVRVRSVQFTVFDSPGMDRVELLSRDGRSIVIVSLDRSVRAYLELEVKRVETPACTSCQARQPTPSDSRTLD